MFEFPLNCTVYTLYVSFVLYTWIGKICTYGHTSSTPIDLYEIPNIFYMQIIHTHSLQTLIGPPMGVEHSGEGISAAASVMQSSS